MNEEREDDIILTSRAFHSHLRFLMSYAENIKQ